MKFTKIAAVLSAAVMAAGMAGMMISPVYAENTANEEYYQVFSGTNPITGEYVRVGKENPADKNGLEFYGNVLVKTDESGSYGYTGRVRVKGKTKFYDNGFQWMGWRKLGGKWYYFDPANDGVMAEEKVKTALGTYYLDEDGAWNGKVSRSALYPEDFGFEVSDWGYGYGFEIGTFDSTFMETHFVEDADVVKGINIPKRDLQIFYDTAWSCGLTSIDEELYGAKLYERSAQKKIDEESGAIVDGEPTDINHYTVKLSVNGKAYTVKGNWTMYRYYDEFEKVRDFAYFLAFTKSYAKGLPQYEEIQAAEAAAAAAIRAAENN